MKSVIVITNRLSEKDLALLREHKPFVLSEEPVSGPVAAAWPRIGCRGFYGISGIKDLQFTLMPDNVTYKLPGEVSIDTLSKLIEGDIMASLIEVTDTGETKPTEPAILSKLDKITKAVSELSELIRDNHPKNVVQITSDVTPLTEYDKT